VVDSLFISTGIAAVRRVTGIRSEEREGEGEEEEEGVRRRRERAKECL
jgi:hypothetical protein